MTIGEAINRGMINLKVHGGIDEPKLKARLLMQFVLNKPRQYLLAYDGKGLLVDQEKIYFKLIDKLKAGVPLQHITHQQEFMKMSFYVDENVLIPRPDTEILVEEVIGIAEKLNCKNGNSKKIMDMCTGSGAIAVSLAKYIKDSEILAVDISLNALNIAKANAKNNMVENQITFVQSDLFENVNKEKYDIIVSNPPYIKKDVLGTLNKDVKMEPQIALDGGIDGLDFYRNILNESFDYLKYDGYICLEIGYDQKEEVIQLLKNTQRYEEIYCKKDLYGNDRVIVAKLK